MKPSYDDIQNHLWSKDIQHKKVSLIGISAPKILRIECYCPGMILEKCKTTLQEVLKDYKGIKFDTNSNEEVVTIEIE